MVLTRRQTREQELVFLADQQQEDSSPCCCPTPANTKSKQHKSHDSTEQQEQETSKRGGGCNSHNILTPTNTYRRVDMRGSASKGVLSHPLVDHHPTMTSSMPCISPRAAAGCEENRLPTGQEPAVVEITYPLIEDMVALRHPEEVEEMVRQVSCDLQSPEWARVCSGMHGLRRLAAYHPVECQGLVGTALPSIVRGIKSPRSALSKSAIMASRDLFMCLPETMGPHVSCDCVDPGNLLTQLLLKAASLDKKFVVEEAVKSLEQMASSVNPLITSSSLAVFGGHKNPKVRGTCYSVLLQVMQGEAWRPQMVIDIGLDRLVRICADGTNDNTAAARESSRKILCMMRDEWILVDDVRAYMESAVSSLSVCQGTEGSNEEHDVVSFEDIDPLVVQYVTVVLGTSKGMLLLKKIL